MPTVLRTGSLRIVIQLAKVQLTPFGFGLHWESLDADLGVVGLDAEPVLPSRPVRDVPAGTCR